MAASTIMNKTVHAIGIAAAFFSAVTGSTPKIVCADAPPALLQTVPLPAGPGPIDNPLKGWCPWATGVALHQPYSLVYCDAAWKELEPREGEYHFADWEKEKWNSPQAAGRHIVMRVWVDYPNSPNGMPDWLLMKGVNTTPYNDPGIGSGLSPDYDNPDMIRGLERLVAAMGRRYDHDPRVAFIELGLLGHWGEWHTYPHPEMFASDATQKRIIDAYHAAFPDKILEARTANGYAGQQPWIGYHDDLFPQDTDGSENWKFLPVMRQSERTQNWQTAAIGGEMDPGNADRWLGKDYPTLQQTIEYGHFTWSGPYCPAQDASTSPEFLARSQSSVREMGYQYVLKTLRLTPKLKQGQTLQLSLTGENQGVAPFYYPWAVQLALIDAQRSVVKIVPVSVDIRKWVPGEFRMATGIPLRMKPGRYSLAIGIIDPYTGKPAVAFANTLPSWQGWTVLSHVDVTH